jgi:hypothetical protein
MNMTAIVLWQHVCNLHQGRRQVVRLATREQVWLHWNRWRFGQADLDDSSVVASTM